MMKKHWPLSILLVLIPLVLGACGEEKSKDPYALVTLRQATRGKVVSKGFRYKFHNPKVASLHRHLGVIREGNLLEFISGRSLEDKMEGLEGKSFSLGVVKEFSPFVHFRVEKIFTETDTIFLSQVGSISYPQVTQESDFNREDFEDYNLGKLVYNKTSLIKRLVNKKLFVTTTLTQVEKEGKSAFMLQAKDSKFRIAEPGDGTTAVLKMLLKGNHPFEGGVTLTEIEPWPSRRSNHIIGTVEVKFVTYGSTVVSG